MEREQQLGVYKLDISAGTWRKGHTTNEVIYQGR